MDNEKLVDNSIFLYFSLSSYVVSSNWWTKLNEWLFDFTATHKENDHTLY